MEKEKTTAEVPGMFPKIPKMIVIKGGQPVVENFSSKKLQSEIRKFTGEKEAITFPISLPLDKMPHRIIKRSIDLVISSIAIVLLLSWLIPLVAILIKLNSKGPVFFLQKMNTRNDRLFTCIQFRSVGETDEYITRVGHFLRVSNIVKLPQLINVLKGEMSLIGPQAHTIDDKNKYEALIKHYNYRYKVKPGMLSLPEAIGYRGEYKNISQVHSSVMLDVYYVRHWSVRLDIKIFLHQLRNIL